MGRSLSAQQALHHALPSARPRREAGGGASVDGTGGERAQVRREVASPGFWGQWTGTQKGQPVGVATCRLQLGNTLGWVFVQGLGEQRGGLDVGYVRERGWGDARL